MISHDKSNYKKLSEQAMERNPKSAMLDEETKKQLIADNAKIAECLHAEWQMLRATEQFHQDVYGNMVAIYQTVPIDRDANLRKMRQLLHEADVKMAGQDKIMDDIYRHYTKKLFPDTRAVSVDDTVCYGVLHDIITTAFGCDTIGNTKETEFEIVRVRKSYLNSLFIADPMAKENIKLTSQN